MSKVMRSVKNVTKGYSSVQVKVRDATSNDPWGPTGTQMQEVAQMTFNSSNEFYEIMDMLDKRLNDKGKNWRHVLKALKVLDYCLHEGSELVVTWARKNIFIIKTLREFQYIDEDGRDVGQNVRVSAKELTALIIDEERLRSERSDRKSWKSRVTGIEEFQSSYDAPSTPRKDRRERAPRPQRADEEDAEYKLAIEASKYQEEEDRRKRESRQGEPDDDDLAKAIKLSKEEEELRRRELEEQNAASLFDDTPAQQMQPTGYNQGYQQGGAIDWSGNPIDQQQTGYPNYNQTGFGAQPTGYQNGFPNGFGAQPTGYDSFGGQQQPFGAQPTGYNPYGQQNQDIFGGQPQQQQQEEPAPAPGTNNPWATPNAGLMAPAKLTATPTGSNNPFASASSQNRTSPFATQQKPTLDTLTEQKTLSQFNTSSFNPPTTFNPPPVQAQRTSQAPQKQQSEYQSRLGALLETGEGMDTFGNVGNLRIPAQHTAPGTFVNSAGAGVNRIHEQQTGSNPFLHNQYTGMPQTSYGGQQVPAQTGPAYGGGSNPFGQRNGQQQGGGDLIQF